MDQKIKEKIYKLSLLLVATVLLILLFIWRFNRDTSSAPVQKNNFQVTPISSGFTNETATTSETVSSISPLPAPDKFSTFVYDSTNPRKSLPVKLTCQDTHYAILIFSVKDDYRENSAAARFNQAKLCQPGEKINLNLDLSALNLSSGKYYYFVADQGLSGSWYNAR